MTAATGNASFQFNSNAGGGNDGRATGEAEFEFTSAALSTTIEIYNSQENISILGAADLLVNSSQIALLTAGTQRAENIFNSQEATLILTQISAKFEFNSQLTLLASGANPMTDVNSSQLAVLTLSRSNPDRRQMRAFTFYQDGHWFYVLHLGNTSTLVFDTLTRKWSEWQSLDYNNWRANYGINWNEDVIAGSIDSNLIFQVSPDYASDDGKAIISRITGGYPMRMRGTLTVDEVMVTSSVGVSTVTSAGTMQLRGSDDYGVTWTDYGTLTLDTATPKTQVSWRSLGMITMPGRIFEIIDDGAARRINSLEMFTRDEQGNPG